MSFWIKLQNLKISYQEQPLITVSDLELCKGDFVSVVGRSGSGKTSLFKAILNLIDYEGEILLAEDCKLSYMPQHFALLKNKTVVENIDLVRGEKDVEYLYEVFGLEKLKDRYPKQLSGGEKARVALLRALSSEANTFLLDEPFGALDKITRNEIYSLLFEIGKKYDLTFIYITHDLEEAKKISKTILVVKEELLKFEKKDFKEFNL